MSATNRTNTVTADTTVTAPSTLSDDAHTSMLNTVSWGAIFAGVVIALVIQVLLTMLGVGIGVATLDPGAGDNPAASTFSISAGIWYILSAVIAAYSGGYIAARMSGRTAVTAGALHGLTAWAFTTLLVLYLLSTAIGSIVGGAFSGVSSAVGGFGRTVAETAAPIVRSANPLDAIEGQVRATGTDPEALQAKAVNAVRAFATGGEPRTDEARQQAAEALAQARGIPVDDANAQIASIEQQYRRTADRASQAATDAADTAASVVSTGALLAFVALALGAIAGWLGGRSGVADPVSIVPARRRVVDDLRP